MSEAKLQHFAGNFLRSSKLKRIVAYVEKLHREPEHQWLASFIEGEVAYLIKKAQTRRDDLTAIELDDIKRSSAWLWMIILAHQKVPRFPLVACPEKVLQEWKSLYGTTIS